MQNKYTYIYIKNVFVLSIINKNKCELNSKSWFLANWAIYLDYTIDT